MIDVTTGKPLRNLVMFTLPILVGNVLQQLYNVVDSIIVGRFAGKDALAAVGTSHPIIMILVALIMGLNVGTEVMLSQSIGERNHEKVNRIANTMFVSIMGVSVLIGVSGVVFARQLLTLIQTPDVIMDEATKYLQIFFIGLPGLAGYNTLNGMIRSSGNTVLPLIFLAIASGLNILLDIVFVRFFMMGVSGVALATVIAQTVSFLLCLLRLRTINPDFQLRMNRKAYSMEALQRGFKLGVPAAVQLSAMSLSTFVIQAFVNNLTLTEILSAYMIGMKVDTFAALPVMSLSLAMVTTVGQNVGAGNEALAKKYEQYGKRGGVLFGIVMSLVMLGLGEEIVTIFIGRGESEVIRYGTMYIRTLSIAYVFVTYYEVAFGVIKGRGKPYVPMIITTVGVWGVRVPLAWILMKQYGFYGVCLAIPIAWATTFLLAIVYEGIMIGRKQNERGKIIVREI